MILPSTSFLSFQLFLRNSHLRFIDSEADLDLAIKSLLPLSQILSVAYPELVKSGTVDHLIGLLSHENMDIVIDVVELIHELTDEDATADEEQDETGKSEESLKLLVDNLVRSSGLKLARVNPSFKVENSILDLLIDNLKRVNEAEESDRQGLFHILGML